MTAQPAKTHVDRELLEAIEKWQSRPAPVNAALVLKVAERWAADQSEREAIRSQREREDKADLRKSPKQLHYESMGWDLDDFLEDQDA